MMFWNMEGDEEERKHHQCKLSSLFVQQAGSLLWGGGGGFCSLTLYLFIGNFLLSTSFKTISKKEKKQFVHPYTNCDNLYICACSPKQQPTHLYALLHRLQKKCFSSKKKVF